MSLTKSVDNILHPVKCHSGAFISTWTTIVIPIDEIVANVAGILFNLTGTQLL